jgi:plastocyanin
MAAVVSMLGATLVALGMPGAALAGGGCHSGPTSGTDPTIVMVGACFDASVTSVDPGTQVTFLNQDPFVHTVAGNGWGHFDDLAQGDRFGVRFDDEGIYPFACTYHPGMTGAIVVGDGIGAGNGPIALSHPVEEAAPIAATPIASGGSPWAVAAIGGAGIALGAGGMLVAGRLRRGASGG